MRVSCVYSNACVGRRTTPAPSTPAWPRSSTRCWATTAAWSRAAGRCPPRAREWPRRSPGRTPRPPDLRCGVHYNRISYFVPGSQYNFLVGVAMADGPDLQDARARALAKARAEVRAARATAQAGDPLLSAAPHAQHSPRPADHAASEPQVAVLGVPHGPRRRTPHLLMRLGRRMFGLMGAASFIFMLISMGVLHAAVKVCLLATHARVQYPDPAYLSVFLLLPFMPPLDHGFPSSGSFCRPRL